MNRLQAFVAVAIIVANGCSSSISTPSQIPQTKPSSPPPTSKIQHVVILFQENRSFNNLFMSFPGADTSTTGRCKPSVSSGSEPICTSKDPRKRIVTLSQIELQGKNRLGGTDIEHSHATFLAEYDGGKMDGFDTIKYGTQGSNGPAGFYPYAYVDRSQVKPYWDMAARYTLADHMFSTATTDSFVAHQEIVAGTARLNARESLVDTPSELPWGCDSFSGTKTSVIFTDGHVVLNGGPFPCLTQYKTMADVLDGAGVSWKYYVQSYDSSSPYYDISGEAWNGFDPIKAVRDGQDWKNVITPNTVVFKDIKNGALPKVSWVIPDLRDSDHPASGHHDGPSWVTSVVNAIGESKYWQSTAIIIMWDDWGGFYDNVPPPQLDYTSLGMRVPMIVVSPYAKRHNVSKTQYEFGSVLKFVEQNFGTASLGSTDARANSIGDVFDFSQAPGKFQPFAAPLGEAYFLRNPAPLPARDIIKHDGGVPD
jgi:phospholipase C